jgi:hypothetical protein
METHSLHQCRGCGFLSIRNKRDWSLGEAPEEYRKTGELTSAAAETYGNLPICFVRAWPLTTEYESRPSSAPTGGPSIATVLHKTRACDEFREWQQGLSPKEHFEMTMLEEQREWQANESAENRRVQRWSMAMNFIGLIVGPILGAAIALWATNQQPSRSSSPETTTVSPSLPQPLPE